MWRDPEAAAGFIGLGFQAHGFEERVAAAQMPGAFASPPLDAWASSLGGVEVFEYSDLNSSPGCDEKSLYSDVYRESSNSLLRTSRVRESGRRKFNGLLFRKHAKLL